jgi:hypothetical protein
VQLRSGYGRVLAASGQAGIASSGRWFNGRSFPVSRAGARDTAVIASWHVPFLACPVLFLELPDKARYESRDIWCEAGRCEIESEQDADQRVKDAQAGVPAQDYYRNGQHDQDRECDSQSTTPFPRPAVSGGQGGLLPAVNPRRDLCRDQRMQAMHFAQAREPSRASAPHAHAEPSRHTVRLFRNI